VRKADGNLQCIVDNSQVQDPLKQADKFDAALSNLYASQGVDGILAMGMVAERESHAQSAANITKAAEQKMPLITEQTVVDANPYVKPKPEVNNQSNITNEDKQEVSTKTGGGRKDSDILGYGGISFGYR
jgi:hypothetical protein